MVVPGAAPRRLQASKIVALVVAVALLAVGGAYGVIRAVRREPRVDALAPADTVFFTRVALKPSGDQRRALASLLGRLPERQREQIMPKIEDFLDEALSEVGLEFRKDVKPWVGAQLGIAVDLPDGPEAEPRVVAILTVTDEKAAESALTKASARGGEPFAFEVGDGIAYLSDSKGHIEELKSGAERAPLSERAEYEKGLERVGSNGLVQVWVDGAGFSEFAGAGSVGFTNGFGSQGTWVMALRVEDEGIVLSGFQTQSEPPKLKAGRPALVEATSGGQLGSVTIFDLGAIAGEAMKFFEGFASQPEDSPPSVRGEPPGNPIDQFNQALGLDLRKDVIPWIHGEFSVVLGGIGEEGPEVGALIEVTDEAAAGRTLDALRKGVPALFGQQGAIVAPRPQGFDVASEDVALAIRQEPGRVVVGSPPAYAESLLTRSSGSLEEDAVYRRVIGLPSDTTSFQMYLRIDRLISAIETFIPAEERPDYERDAAPYLRLFKALGIRATSSKDETTFRMLISISER